MVGPTGTGKSWLACALGHAACRQGATVRYVRLPRLLGDLAPARGDGSYGRLLQQFAKADLLILDDWGLAPIGDRERRDLLEIIEDRTGRRATLLTSQCRSTTGTTSLATPRLATRSSIAWSTTRIASRSPAARCASSNRTPRPLPLLLTNRSCDPQHTVIAIPRNG